MFNIKYVKYIVMQVYDNSYIYVIALDPTDAFISVILTNYCIPVLFWKFWNWITDV